MASSWYIFIISSSLSLFISEFSNSENGLHLDYCIAFAITTLLWKTMGKWVGGDRGREGGRSGEPILTFHKMFVGLNTK